MSPLLVSTGLAVVGMLTSVAVAFGMMRMQGRWLEKALNGLRDLPSDVARLHERTEIFGTEILRLRDSLHDTRSSVAALNANVELVLKDGVLR